MFRVLCGGKAEDGPGLFSLSVPALRKPEGAKVDPEATGRRRREVGLCSFLEKPLTAVLTPCWVGSPIALSYEDERPWGLLCPRVGEPLLWLSFK